MNFLAGLALLTALSAGAADDAYIEQWLKNRELRPVPSDSEVAGYLTRRSYEENVARQNVERAARGLPLIPVPSRDRAVTPKENPAPQLTVAPLVPLVETIERPTVRELAEPAALPLVSPIIRQDGETTDAFIARAQAEAAVAGERAARDTAERVDTTRIAPEGQERAERSVRGLTGMIQRLFRPREGGSGGVGSSGSGSSGAGSSGFSGSSGSGSSRGGASMGGATGGLGAAMSMSDLQVAQSGGLGQPFRDMGLKVGEGAGGRAAVLRKDGSPASAAEVAELQSRLGREPLAQMQRPDFHQVLPRDKFQELRSHYATKPELRASTFRDVTATPEVRDFQWSRTCGRLDGNCNPNATQGSYSKGRYVAPEDLKNMSLDATKRLAAGGAETAKKEEKPRAKRGQEFWDRLQKEDEEFQKKLAEEEASRKPAAGGGKKSRLGALLEALSGALGAGGDNGAGGAADAGSSARDYESTLDYGVERAAPGAEGAAVEPGARQSDVVRMRQMPAELPAPDDGGGLRRFLLGAFMAGLTALLVVFVRRRLAERAADAD